MINFLIGVGAGMLLTLITLIAFFVRHRMKELKKLKQGAIDATKRANELLKLINKGKLLVDRSFRTDVVQILDYTPDKLRIKYKQMVLDGIRVQSNNVLTTDLATFLKVFDQPTEEEMEKNVLPFIRRAEAELAGLEYDEI